MRVTVAFFAGMAVLLILLIGGPAWMGIGVPSGWGVQPTCTVSSIDLNPNPVTEGATETITGTADEATSGTGCTAGTAGTDVTAGRITIEEKAVGSTGVSCSTDGLCTAGNVGASCSAAGVNAACDSSPGAGDGVCTLATFVEVAHEDPTDGTFATTAFDTTGLGGSTIGFRSHYAPTGGAGFKESQSPCEDLIIETAEETCTPGATIAATFASGDGTPTPDSNNATPDGPWTFRLTVTACGPLTGVTAQGGANGWAPFVPPAVPDSGIVAVRKSTNKNTILLWTIGDMTDGQVANLDVTVNGNIPKNAPDGQIRYLSGPWSAIFSTDGGATFEKSDYTGRVTVCVDQGGGACP